MREEDYYSLYERNLPLISLETQGELKKIKVGVAGCGSTGGAVIDGFLRLGVTNYHLCDNGDYELNNLNRQMVFREDIGKNKAEVQSSRVLNINPNASVNFWNEGITKSNINEFLTEVDFLFDAVDVTEREGMDMKLLLHEVAHAKKIPVSSSLDLGYLQWVKGYNYQNGEDLLGGKMEAAKKAKSPLKALIDGFISLEEIPLELLKEAERLIKDPSAGACQLGSACFLLSSIMGPYLINFVNKKKLPDLVKIDLMEYFESQQEKEERKARTKEAVGSLSEFLKGVV